MAALKYSQPRLNPIMNRSDSSPGSSNKAQVIATISSLFFIFILVIVIIGWAYRTAVNEANRRDDDSTLSGDRNLERLNERAPVKQFSAWASQHTEAHPALDFRSPVWYGQHLFSTQNSFRL
ncbi:hypothetical protein BX600DRAFT_434581 [Xylariales sp. PMI_506]|nr:hypothetical protein BX600DRAFT_434581 [Xylariales sp. PMI_506]